MDKAMIVYICYYTLGIMKILSRKILPRELSIDSQLNFRIFFVESRNSRIFESLVEERRRNCAGF